MTPKQIYQHNQQQIEDLQFIMAERTKPTFCLITFDSYLGINYLKKQLQDALPQYQFIDLDTKPEELTSLAVYINKTLQNTTVGFAPDGTVTTVLNVFGLEMSLNPQLIGQINIEREHLFRTFPCVIFLWLNEENSLRLRREAADFASWITYDFTFFTPETEREKVDLTEKVLKFDNINFVDEKPLLNLKQEKSKIIALQKELKKLNIKKQTERIKNEKVHLLENIVNLYYHIKNYREAIKTLDYAIKIQSDNYRLLGSLASLYYENGDYEKALKYYKKSSKIQPLPISFIGMANCYMNLSKYQDAIYYCSKAIQLSPNDAINYKLLGMIFYRIQDYANAIVSFNDSLKMDYDNKVHLMIGVLYQKIGNLKKSNQIYLKILKTYFYEPLILQIIHNYIILKELDEAEKYCVALKDKNNILYMKDVLQLLGLIYMCRHNKKDALRYYQQSLALFENKADFFKQLNEDYQHLQYYNITKTEFEDLQKQLQ